MSDRKQDSREVMAQWMKFARAVTNQTFLGALVRGVNDDNTVTIDFYDECVFVGCEWARRGQEVSMQFSVSCADANVYTRFSDTALGALDDALAMCITLALANGAHRVSERDFEAIVHRICHNLPEVTS